MTTKAPTSQQIQPYLDVLETKLRDLPEDEKVELLGDLESHLEEILTDESDTALGERIGTPTAYANEFAASIGLEDARTPSRSLAETISASLGRIGDHPTTERAHRLWGEMRPAWWTIRGLTIGLLLLWNYLGPGDPGAEWVVQLIAAAILVAFIGVSMRIGRIRDRNRGWRWLSLTITIAGLLAGLGLTANISARMNANYYEYYQNVPHDDYGSYQDSYPYGPLGEQDIQFMSDNDMSLEEYFNSGYFQDLRQRGFGPPITYVPSDRPTIVTP